MHHHSKSLKAQRGCVTGMIIIINTVGGTTSLSGRYPVQLLSGFEEYEWGGYYKGKLLRKKDIETARIAGTCEWGAEYYRDRFPGSPHLADKAEKALKEFDPSIVYFSEHNFKPEAKMFQGFVIKAPVDNLPAIGQFLKAVRLQIKHDYKQQAEVALELGKIKVRARSIVVECGGGTHLNILSQVVAKLMPEIWQAKVPSWS